MTGHKLEYKKLEYQSLYALPYGGTYNFFKNIILKNAIISVFLGNAILVLILLITTTIWTSNKLDESNLKQMEKMNDLGELTQNQMIRELHNVMVPLNYTKEISDLNIFTEYDGELDNDLYNSQISFYDVTQNGFNQNIYIYWWAPNIYSVDNLDDDKREQLQYAYTLCGFQVLTENSFDDEQNRFGYFFFQDTGFIVTCFKSQYVYQESFYQFTLFFTTNYLCDDLLDNCSEQSSPQSYSMCDNVKKECEYYEKQCGITDHADFACSYEIQQNFGKYDFNFYPTVYSVTLGRTTNSSDTYDSRSILSSLTISRLPLYYLEELTDDERFNNFGIFYFTSQDYYDNQLTFFEIYAYLFFFFSSLEIIFIILSFSILTLRNKIYIIRIVQAINYLKEIFDQVGNKPYIQLDKEIRQFQNEMHKKNIPQEIQELSRNLNDFLWIVDNNHDKKMIGVLVQKVLYHKAQVCIFVGEYQIAFQYLFKSMTYKDVYYNKIRIKCLKKMGQILERYKEEYYAKSAQFLIQYASFYRKDKRDFYILVDSTKQLNTNVDTVIDVIKSIYFEQMKETDTLSLFEYNKNVQSLLKFHKKQITQEDQIDNLQQNQDNQIHEQQQKDPIFGVFDQLKQHKQIEQRDIIYSCFQALQELNSESRINRPKYLIVFIFGENNYNYEEEIQNQQQLQNQQSDIINTWDSNKSNQKYMSNKPNLKINVIEEKEFNKNGSQIIKNSPFKKQGQFQNNSNLFKKNSENQEQLNEENNDLNFSEQSPYINLVLVGENLKKYGYVKKNKYLRLFSIARKFYLIDFNNKTKSKDILKELLEFIQ
ncbi:hypothetical protein PPERSA_08192 [Pseudocohnilembus persalinus]|uniref:Transmembrane protein n=1 Tax=Pseudocohnilembus persalinus TaxID=266149 RepID=A0A0V0R3E1_PSEPJ|nr:hypothetical protein PPERSA_08192 [Pseudocohnilembus persalinus]|eukprot:KRX08989.1 hypothetical protein PPERSA_08192 [Pseudocohnilembus persalinus]